MGAAVDAQRARRGGALNRTQGCAGVQRPHVGLEERGGGIVFRAGKGVGFRAPLARPDSRRPPV